MKTLFVVNDVREVAPKMSTTLLMAAAARKHDVSVCGVDDFSVVHGEPAVGARHVTLSGEEATPARIASSVSRQQPKRSRLQLFDMVVVRTNPGRDLGRHASHATAMHMLRECRALGVDVVNTPRGLARAATKVYLASLPPEVVPELIVSRNAQEMEAWARELDDSVVLKPITGTRGNDVFVVHRSDLSNLRQMIHVVTRNGYAMAQRFLPEAASGDTRALVVNGRILEVDGRAASVSRVPAKGDFRSNVHAGGRAAVGHVTEGMRAAISLIGEQLVEDGLFFVGLDFIADRIIEVNVFSPGGLGNAMDQQQRDFAAAVVDELELLCQRGGA